MNYRSRFCLVFQICAAVLLMGPVFAQGEVVELTDKAGTKLVAKLISLEGKAVKVVRESDGKSFQIPMDRLDEASAKRVQAWVDGGGNLSETFAIDFQTQKNRKTTAADDFDDKRINMEPVITLKNPDSSRSTREGMVSVLVLGRPIADTSQIYVFRSQSFDLKSIKPLESLQFQVTAFSEPYDDRGYAKFGSRYLGYAVLIHDKEKKRLFTSNSVPDALLTNWGLRLLNLEEKGFYTKDFKPVVAR